MTQQLKIALIQFQSLLGDVDGSTEKAIKLCVEASMQNAKFICLPELFSTGYNLNLIGERLPSLAESIDGPTITKLRKTAHEQGCYIIAPIALYREVKGVFFNSAVLIDYQGEVVGVYDKNHLWDLEKGFFRNGKNYPVFETKYGKIGIIICYDMGFPEASRILTLKGAELIFCPSAWRIQDKDIWDLNIPQRALENTVYLAAVNRVGREGDLIMFGASKVSNPRGEILAQASDSSEEILYCDMDLAKIGDYRLSSPYLRDIRPDQYLADLWEIS